MYRITKSDFLNLLQHLLREKIVSEVLSGKEKRNRYAIVPEFISNPEELTDFPLSQLLTYGYSRLDSASNEMLHSKKALTIPVGLVARACDIRALVELDKKEQLKWENLFLIGFHDLGKISNKQLKKYFKKEEIDDATITHERTIPTHLLLKFKDGSKKEIPLGPDLNIEGNCLRCIQKNHPLADMVIGTYTLPNDSEEYLIFGQSDRGKSILSQLGWENMVVDDAFVQKYDEFAANIITTCQAKREKDLGEYLSNENRFELMTSCTACGMCVKSCPVCFCVTCNLLDQIKAKTMTRMTFLTTRFTHIGDTCVECGKCTAVCPMNIPLDLFFQSLRDKFKTARNFESGVDSKQKVMHLDV
jgi:formate dehydrogenase subunit beta